MNVPDENPSGLGAFDLPLRLPGQYFDKETNLHYNYFRDYDPSIGRYGKSDPIGLRGGLNTYLYVNGNPLKLIDPVGLEWVFVNWEIEEYQGWWAHWRRLIAVCYETCTKLTQKQEALYEQWRPMQINTPTVPSHDPFGNSPHWMDTLVSIAKAVDMAKKQGGTSKQETMMQDPESGLQVCSKLPFPGGNQGGQCCPDTR